jgi:hypothetical protein
MCSPVATVALQVNVAGALQSLSAQPQTNMTTSSLVVARLAVCWPTGCQLMPARKCLCWRWVLLGAMPWTSLSRAADRALYVEQQTFSTCHNLVQVVSSCT